MSIHLYASDNDGHLLADGRYAGQWTADVDCFVNADTATLQVRRDGVARWLFAFWPSGAPMGVAELRRELPTEAGGSLVLPAGDWSVAPTPVTPEGAPPFPVPRLSPTQAPPSRWRKRRGNAPVTLRAW